MARLASQAKLGYYPTPPGIVEHIKKALVLPEPGTYRIIDTCCGEGEALAQLTNGLDNQESIIETYGVELDEGRYQVATQKLDKVLWGDALNEITVSSKAFSLLWLNPPYDWNDSRRLEAQFLEAHLRYLAPRGWLVFIIPHQALKNIAKMLATKLGDLRIYAFPELEFQAFKQMVVIGQQRPVANRDEQFNWIHQLAIAPATQAWEMLPKMDEIPEGLIILPPSPAARNLIFSCERLDLIQAGAVVRKSPLWQELMTATAAKDFNGLRPLAPLRQGHLAMLLAGGLMNGEVCANGRHLVIKGSVRKRVDSMVETTETHLVETHTEKFEIVIRAIDLNKNEIFSIQ
jgi:hypothetical protein